MSISENEIIYFDLFLYIFRVLENIIVRETSIILGRRGGSRSGVRDRGRDIFESLGQNINSMLWTLGYSDIRIFWA